MKTGFVILIIASAFSCGHIKKKESGIQLSNRMEKIYVKIDDNTISTRDPMKVIDPLWWTVNIYKTKEQYEKDLKPFSFHQRSILAIMWYMAEVNNGGHYQFFTNPTGIVWEDAMNGFNLIGLNEGKKILEESAKRFGSKPSFDRTERENLLDSIDEDFDDLDSQFYKLDSEINITEKIAEYIIANPIPFYFEGEIEVSN